MMRMGAPVLSRFAVALAITLSTATARADEPIEIFDAHMHYNWEPKPYYQPDEVRALFKKHRVTGVLATSRPNTGIYPDRFLLGSDTWVPERWASYGDTMDGYRAWLAQLPPPIARQIAHGNA
jgi:hypothetical protein